MDRSSSDFVDAREDGEPSGRASSAPSRTGMCSSVTAGLLADQTPEQIAAEIQSLVQADRIRAARQRLAGLSSEQRAHHTLSKWARLLEPPRILPGKPGNAEPVEKNAAWLRMHGADYFGEWVALRGGELLGHHRSHFVLFRELEQKGDLAGALFVRLVEG